jgi:hypothetical protein
MATECGGVNVGACAFENEVLIVEYDFQMRSLPSSILLGVERDPCHFIQMIDLRYGINRLYIHSAAVVARKYIRYIYKIKKPRSYYCGSEEKDSFLSGLPYLS